LHNKKKRDAGEEEISLPLFLPEENNERRK